MNRRQFIKMSSLGLFAGVLGSRTNLLYTKEEPVYLIRNGIKLGIITNITITKGHPKIQEPCVTLIPGMDELFEKYPITNIPKEWT